MSPRPFGDLQALLLHLDARVTACPAYADLRNLRGLVRAHHGDAHGARSDFEQALALNPQYATARFNLAWLHTKFEGASGTGLAVAVAQSLPDAARAQIDFVRRARLGGTGLSPDACDTLPVPVAWRELNRLWVCVQSADQAAVSAQLRRIGALDGDFPALLHAAGILRDGVQDEASMQAWAAAYDGNPYVDAVGRVAADLALAGGDEVGARRALAWGASLSLDLGAYWVALGTQYESRGEEHAALVALGRAVRVDGERVEARIALGFLFAARGQVANAIEQFEAASRLAPGYADVRYELGLLYTADERFDQAIAELGAALAAHPGYVLAQLALGNVFAATGRDGEAVQLLQSVRATGLRSADVEATLAQLHERLGHPIQARRARERARAVARGTSRG